MPQGMNSMNAGAPQPQQTMSPKKSGGNVGGIIAIVIIVILLIAAGIYFFMMSPSDSTEPKHEASAPETQTASVSDAALSQDFQASGNTNVDGDVKNVNNDFK